MDNAQVKQYTKKVAEWFTSVKAPELKEAVDKGMEFVNSDKAIEGKHRGLFGFMFFSYSMNHGPTTFLDIEEVVEGLGITEEFKTHAKDWIDYSKKSKRTSPN